MQNELKQKNNKRVRLLATMLVAIGCFFSHVHGAQAARLYVDVPDRTYGVGDTFFIPVKFDAEGDDINTISADILFPDSLLSVTELRDNDSPITNWVEQPTISGNSVSFSGIIPGGFSGLLGAGLTTKGPATLLWLVVHADAAGSDLFTFADAHAYQNDGLGTEAALETAPVSITLSDQGSNASITETDTTPPEAFIPIVTESPLIYNDKYIVVFNTTDKGTGVAYYEVSEGNGAWKRATSPYLLTDQTLRSTIRVRAFDYAGNVRTVVVGTPFVLPQYIFVLLIVAIALLLYVLYYRYNKSRRARAL